MAVAEIVEVIVNRLKRRDDRNVVLSRIVGKKRRKNARAGNVIRFTVYTRKCFMTKRRIRNSARAFSNRVELRGSERYDSLQEPQQADRRSKSICRKKA